MTQLIAIDMDGTLLNDDREVTIENAKAIEEAQQQGKILNLLKGH